MSGSSNERASISWRMGGQPPRANHRHDQPPIASKHGGRRIALGDCWPWQPGAPRGEAPPQGGVAMTLTRVTITGADDDVDVTDLMRLSDEFQIGRHHV